MSIEFHAFEVGGQHPPLAQPGHRAAVLLLVEGSGAIFFRLVLVRHHFELAELAHAHALFVLALFFAAAFLVVFFVVLLDHCADR